MLIFDLLYMLILVLSLPLWIKYFFKKHYRDILKHRLRPNIATSNGKERLWVHAVSVGEVRSLGNFIPQFQKSYPDNPIVLSVTTPAGYDCACEIYAKINEVTVINAPLDFSFTVRRFLQVINPRVLILNELEIWPNWVHLAHRRGIPIVLINGRISELAFRSYKRWRFLVKSFFEKISSFLVQAELYRERFIRLGIPEEKITVCGNIKSDVAYDSLSKLPGKAEIWEHLGFRAGEKRVLLIASSHRSDEELVIPFLPGLLDRYFCIIVPRHLTRLEEIEKRLRAHGISYQTWSKRQGNTNPELVENGQGINASARVLIYDRMGYLFALLKVADIVFMGGTLERKIGGHNLFEPAVLGKPIIGGPCYNNFPDVGDELVEKGVYRVVETSAQFRDMLTQWNHDNEAQEKVKTAAIHSVTRRRGSIQCILEEIRSVMR